MGPLAVVILAAGKGVRMKSELPKVCHLLNGEPLIAHVLQSVTALAPAQLLIIIGHQAEKVREACGPVAATFVVQQERLGTGHAVMQAIPHLRPEIDHVMVVSGDVPLLRSESLQSLRDTHEEQHVAATVLTAVLDRPGSYGRVVRGPDGSVQKIVEDRDASPSEKKIHEVNTGTYVFQTADLTESLMELQPQNAQSEYYLTDVIGILRNQHRPVAASVLEDPREMSGINTPDDLAYVASLKGSDRWTSSV